MKNIFLIILTLFLAITSSKNKATEAKAEPSKDNTVKKEEPNCNISRINRRPDKSNWFANRQHWATQSKIGLKDNGKLTLLPQNQAQVSIFTGGFIKTINVTEGTFVKQGQTLATILNNEVIQLQQNYLENKSQFVLPSGGILTPKRIAGRPY